MYKNNSNLRHELKYYINYFEYHSLRNRLNRVLDVDDNAGYDRDYHIRSLYFEDNKSTSLAEKQSGLISRMKWRIRIYNLDSKVIKLEKKAKIGHLVNKQNHQLSLNEYYSILENRYEFLLYSRVPLLIEFYSSLKNQQYKPKVIVDYRREAYISKISNTRITFDKYLRTGLDSIDLFNKIKPTINVIEENIMIMEVKYDSFLPEYIKDIIQLSSSQRSAISKYVISTKYTKKNKWEDQ
jgi:hypothetical protein